MKLRRFGDSCLKQTANDSMQELTDKDHVLLPDQANGEIEFNTNRIESMCRQSIM